MRISWTQVFADYLMDETASYQKLADKYQVSKRSIVRHAVKENWKLKKEKILQKSIQNVTKNAADAITEAKIKHLELAQRLQDEALDALANNKVKIKNPSQLLILLKAGIKLERECWEIQKTLNALAKTSFILPTLPIVPENKKHKENMEKIKQITNAFQSDFSSKVEKRIIY